MIYVRAGKLLRLLQPDIVHTRNLSILETQLPALIAGVPYRVHGEHGRDIDGTNKKYQLLHRMFKLFIQKYVALSLNLQGYLRENTGVSEHKLDHICNGVDTDKFRPAEIGARDVLPKVFAEPDTIVFGTVGRMEAVKDQVTLAQAFGHMVAAQPQGRMKLRLIMVVDVALREPAMKIIKSAGLDQFAWFPEELEGVHELVRALDVFVLPSLAEGVSNTIPEVMASGLPVMATDEGGNSELVEHGSAGFIVARGNPVTAKIMQKYADSPKLQLHYG